MCILFGPYANKAHLREPTTRLCANKKNQQETANDDQD